MLDGDSRIESHGKRRWIQGLGEIEVLFSNAWAGKEYGGSVNE